MLHVPYLSTRGMIDVENRSPRHLTSCFANQSQSVGSRFGSRVTSRRIGEPLSLRSPETIPSARNIIDPELIAIVVAKIEFSQIAVQMPSIAMLVHADHGASEDGEKTVDGVGMNFATHVLPLHVGYSLVAASNVCAKLSAKARLIGCRDVRPSANIPFG